MSATSPGAPDAKARPFVGIQVGAVSFVDEGVRQALDIFQEKACVNALFLATPTWHNSTGGRQVPGQPFPDHGAQEPELGWRGGSFVPIHPQHYGRTSIGTDFRAREHGDFDLFAAVLPEAKRRGMASFAWINESATAQALKDLPNFPKVLELDFWGRPGWRPCYNQPDYRYWQLGIVEDYCKSYPDLAGVALCSERYGPLDRFLHSRTDAYTVGCFCEHCQAKLRDRGHSPERGIAGYRRLWDWNQAVGRSRPPDGAFVTFWRLLLEYPEILAWAKLWADSQHRYFRDVYGLVKAADGKKLVGLHLYHMNSFSPWLRAEEDYADFKRYFDFIKVVVYHSCAGPRFHTFVRGLHQAIFADATPAETYPLLLKILGYEEAPFEELPRTGFSADYVRREIARAVQGVNNEIPIYAGIDVDVPTEPGEKKNTPEDICTGVKAAFAGGAQGIVLSRKYSEMRLASLAGAGQALRELGFASKA